MERKESGSKFHPHPTPSVNLSAFQRDIARGPRLGEQHVLMARHAAGHGMEGEPHLLPGRPATIG